MPEKPTYEELEQRVLDLERTLAEQTTVRDLHGGISGEENERNCRLIVENANEAILVAQDGAFVFSNPMGLTLFGCSQKELGSRPFTEFVHEADRKMMEDRHQGRLAGDLSIPDFYRLRIIHQSGEIRWASLKTAVFSWKNRPAEVFLMVDITERKRTEDKLRESESRYRAIFQNRHVVMLVIDPDTGAIRDANPAAVGFYGWSHEELTRMKITEVNTLPPSEVEKQMRAARQKNCDFFNFQHRLRDGSVRDVEVSSGPVEYGQQMLLYSIVRDITSRKRAEEALRESEKQFRNIADNVPGMVMRYQLNPDGSDKLLYVSKGVADLYKVLPEDAVKDHTLLWKRIHRDDLEEFRVSIKESAEKLSLWERQCRIELPDGRVKWLHKCGVPAKQDDGSVIWDTLAIDITEKRQSEEALQETEAKYRRLLDALEEGYLKADLDGYIETANAASAKLFDFASPEDMRGMHMEKLYADPDDRKGMMRKLKKKFFLRNYPLPCAAKSGRLFWASCNIRLIVDENGVMEGTEALFRDVTDIKRTEDALREKDAMYRLLFENANVGICIYDTCGVLQMVNKKNAEILGGNPDDFIGKSIHELFPSVADYHMDRFNKIIEEKKGAIFDDPFTLPDGEHWFTSHLQPIVDKDSSIKGLQIVAFDITDRKRAEAALKKSLAEKEVLLREIHHRVKNNMQTIIGLLRMHARRTSDARAIEKFNDCQNRIGAMSLIHEALYQSGNLAKIDFNAYLKKLWRNFAQFYEGPKRKIDLKANVAGVKLEMDQGVAVGMIIAELISNAFKHAFPNDDGGTVNVHLDLPGGESVRLVVSDTGVGLPPDFNLQNPPSLGLRLVTGAVTRELGGSIEAAGNGGAKFVIHFKFAK